MRSLGGTPLVIPAVQVCWGEADSENMPLPERTAYVLSTKSCLTRNSSFHRRSAFQLVAMLQGVIVAVVSTLTANLVAPKPLLLVDDGGTLL